MKHNINDRKAVTRLLSLTDTLRSEGLFWLIRRLRYRTPITPWGRALHLNLRRCLGMLLSVSRAIKRMSDRTAWNEKDSLYAFYDLQVAPITFDVSWFAAAADRQRRKKGLSRIHFVIIPGNKDGFREERAAYETTVDTAARLWRLHNVIIPVLTLVPSFGGLTLLARRGAVSSLRADAGDRVYPEHYEPALPIAHLPVELFSISENERGRIGILQSSTQALRHVEHWIAPRLSDRRLITITLRDYLLTPARNSNMNAWGSFARRLDSSKYLPVFVLDTERTLDPSPPTLSGFEVFREASWNVWLRMALYESSYLNLGVNNGPMFLCMLNARTRLLIFKILTPSVPQTTEELMSKLGYEIGGQLPFATQFQRLVWQDDTLETIEREFYALVAKIEKANNSPPSA